MANAAGSGARLPRRRPGELGERLFAILALVTVLAAYYLGAQRTDPDLRGHLKQALPTADRFEPLTDTIYTALERGRVTGYVAVNSAPAFNAPIKLAAGFDLDGRLVNYSVIEHYETPEYFDKVDLSDLRERLLGKSYLDTFKVGEDVDGISGATYTTVGIVEAIRRAGLDVAEHASALSVPIGQPQKVAFGIPEITLIALFAVGFFAHRQDFKYKKAARWASLITGMLVLGFWFNRPLTISKISQFLLGFFPPWETNLYWYLLIGGILFVFTRDNKNPYCEWFCPFGAAQECLAAVGGAKVRSPGRYRSFLKWLQRFLAWLAIVAALYFRNPGVSSYEIFGTLFKQIGTTVSFLLLGIILIAALFIKRPWCTYLCPLHPVDEFIRLIRRWIFELWHRFGPQNKRS